MHGDETTRPVGLLLATKGRDFDPSSSKLGANGLTAARTPSPSYFGGAGIAEE